MDCRVVVEAAVPVYDVSTPEDAIRIAVAKTGKMLNPDLNYVDIDKGSRTTPAGEELPPAFVAADEALVALELRMTVFNVEGEEHASRIAQKEIGTQLEGIPLKILGHESTADSSSTSTSDSDRSGGSTADAESASEAATGSEDSGESNSSERSGANEGSTDERDEASTTRTERGNGDDDLLPGFEEMVEENSS